MFLTHTVHDYFAVFPWLPVLLSLVNNSTISVEWPCYAQLCITFCDLDRWPL